ncbi:MAG: hypothetical protein K0R57_4271 [Paenibacillaceae bacterium]|jgi:hypothetical protein|nr:hypothetical protein [Paenibacillaceae bacterium]
MTIISQWTDCYAYAEGTSLTVGNDKIERTWSFAGGLPVSQSIVDKARNKQWVEADNESPVPVFSFPWLSQDKGAQWIRVQADRDNDYGIAREHQRVWIDMAFAAARQLLRLTVLIYPGGSIIRQEISFVSYGDGDKTVDEAEGLLLWEASADEEGEKGGRAGHLAGLDDNAAGHVLPAVGERMETLALNTLHCRWETVCFRDVTDRNNNLVSRDKGLLYPNEHRGLRGNLLVLRETLAASGLMLIKESATPLGHARDAGADFLFEGKRLSVTGAGLAAGDIHDEAISAYGTVIGVFDGSEYGQHELLHRYHRFIRPYLPERDSFLMSNTWGDRSRDGRVSEVFLLQELQRAAELGLDIVQIDDGWQKGITSNSVEAAAKGGRWGDFYSGGDDFWSEHPERFPRGLRPVAELARQLGIKLGLWFSLDATGDYMHWEKDVAQLLRLHREYGIAAFKLDGIQIHAKTGEQRLVQAMQQVVRETGGRVVFNLDATSQKRLGYFGKTQYGNLFLENRYTDWGSYYPHWTLRNLWLMASYVPAERLQIEFLNVERNRGKYGDDPLAPAHCGQLYALACTLFANPLAWMELTGLNEEQRASLAALIKTVKPHHSAILSGHILPVGDEPSGTGWPGLQSMVSPGQGYLLLFRELAPQASVDLKLWGLGEHPLELTGVAGMYGREAAAADGLTVRLEPDSHGAYSFSFPQPFSFALWRYEAVR